MSLTREKRGRGVLATVFGGLWRAVDGLRRLTLNLLFLGLVVALAALAWTSRAPALKERTVLVIDLDGPVVEQRSGTPRDALFGWLSESSPRQVALRDIQRALDHAARDADVSSVLLTTDGLSGGGLATQREVAAAITRFRASGKKVVAWGMQYDQRAYYLAAHADEVYMHPMGAVLIEGYGRQRNYYRDALDRLGVSANVIRAGQFKNAAEPFMANAPSPQTIESESLVYEALWALYIDGVEKARRLPAGHVLRMIEGLPANLVAAGGDSARLALDLKLVDGLMTPDALRTLLVERGAKDERLLSFRQVSLTSYLSRVKTPREGDAVAVVVAEGEIVEGEAPAGRVGGRSTAELIRQAREDEHVKAVVLRVDSPGGSATGSELIRRELQMTRAAGKPVVVSMGDLAASGGYWISLAADELVADPATITGSIGVFAMLPTGPGLMDKLSLHTGGTGTTWLVGAYDPRRPLDERFARVVQSVIDHIYADFTAKAAAARKTGKDKIDAVAQGRIWTGAQARERGLIDRVGSFNDALASARAKARLPADARVQWMEREGGRLSRLLDGLGAQAWGERLQAAGWLAPPLPAPPAVLAEARADLAWLAELTQQRAPFAAVVHCLCGPVD
ncbi:MAG: signal peptide peptidase SppA [Rubrivivax sp.]|nr:signal peptide peptidase SppA [Rubrivivax sp.]